VPVALVAGAATEASPALSPDGRWLAYDSNETGNFEIYVVPFPNTAAAKFAISSGGGTEPQWSHKGNELFYRDKVGNLTAVSLTTTPTFSVGRQTALFPAAAFESYPFDAQYAVGIDDKRFLMIRQFDANVPDRLVVVEHWFQELAGMAQAGSGRRKQ
jgi:serine/threonine-protein kinase